MKHIQQETGCRVQIKGRGSGYLEGATNRESDEDMYLHVAYVQATFLSRDACMLLLTSHSGPDAGMVEKAKELCEDLVANVKEQYDEFKSRPPRYNDRGGQHGGDRYRGGNDRHHDRGNQSYGGYGQDRYGQDQNASTNSPAHGANSPATNAADYAAQYAQYYGGADPYAAYGGYAK